MNIPAALLAATLVVAPAHHHAPHTTVSTPGGMCLTAAGVPAAPVVVAPCDHGAATQEWAFTPAGRFRLKGTSEYMAGPFGIMLGDRAQAFLWTYAAHTLTANGLRLTWCPDSGTVYPQLKVGAEPKCQAWNVTTKT